MDTSVWYAAADRGDRSHARAADLLTSGERLVTSDHVLVETWFLLNARLHRPAAERFWEELRGGVAALEPVTAADLEVAWAVQRDFPDQPFSLVDRTSFALMQRLGLFRAASFDQHFAVFRFGRALRQAFEVVR